METPWVIHQRILGNLIYQIGCYLENKKQEVYAAPFDVRFTNQQKIRSYKSIISVVQPDISVICEIDKLDKRAYMGAPDWIIEILSPGNKERK